ncbi:hypothetical protein MATL_G00175170 [Megalops atlanticus]|uniref:Ig-like domain-containing protein n=1 Tax=Megalops atlanticus TaxID=7932 RepID=A0A9D3PS62_MEGAT|nr:hypothetical protein MATL_G00175170 [Megalops atlanticus]
MYLVLVLFWSHGVSSVTHSLQYAYTGALGIAEFPEFIATGVVDDFPIMHYDSERRRTEPRQEWMERNLETGYWESETATSQNQEELVKRDVKIAMERYNHSDGAHTVQLMYGCELDDDGSTRGFMQYGYDGEDHIVLDLETMTWTTVQPQAAITKQEWDSDRARNAYLSDYFTQECIEWLKQFVGFGRSSLERKIPPEVSVFQKDSQVTCHVTGFFPRGILVSWERDGEEVYEGVRQGEILPNEDGTFQMRSTLEVSPEELQGHLYTCRVMHSSQDEWLIRPWEPNQGTPGPGGTLPPPSRRIAPPTGPPLGIIIGCVVAVMLLAAGVTVWKKSRTGYGKTNTSDTDSENSSNPAMKA